MPEKRFLLLTVLALAASALACGGDADERPRQPDAKTADTAAPPTPAEAVQPEAVQPNAARPGAATPRASTDTWFAGDWRLVKYGAPAYIDKGDDRYLETPMHAAAGMSLRVNGDSTWSWADPEGNPLSGQWRPMTAAEDPNFGGKNGIVILNGQGGGNWTVVYSGQDGGVDNVRIVGDNGNYYGVRTSTARGVPPWAKRSGFQPGTAVDIETLIGGDWCSGTITSLYNSPDGLPYYNAEWQCPGDSTPRSGVFPPNRLRAR